MNPSPRPLGISFHHRIKKTVWLEGSAAFLSLSLLLGVAHASRPTTAWTKANTGTGDFYDATLWNAGLPSPTQDAIIDNFGTAVIDTGGHDSIPYVYLGSQQNTGGTLNIVAGGDAKFTTLSIGVLNATGNLNISGGGKLTTFGGPIGSDYLGVGNANITGAGSSWKVTGPDMVVGGNGTGNLTLMSSGNLNVGNGTGRVQMGIHPLAEGNLYMGNGGLSGTLTASEIYNGEGRGTVIFNHTNTLLNFSTKLTGTKTLNGYLNLLHKGTGTTVLSGNSELGGSTKTETINAGTPQEEEVTVIVPAVTVESGTLLVTGSIRGSYADIIEDGMIIGQEKAVGEILVKSAGTLGGTGFIEGKTTNQGTLSPGVALGVLTFGGDLNLTSTGKVKFELGGRIRGTGYDGLNVEGDLFYGGILEIVLANGFLPVAGDTFDLFQGFASSLGSFSSVVFTSGSYVGSFNTATGDLSIVAVPEPTILGMATAGLITLGFARRNRGTRLMAS